MGGGGAVTDIAVSGRHGYRSAYSYGPGAFTTSKWRDAVQTRVIDFVWHSSALHSAATLRMPALELVLPTHLPLPVFPSDHLSIAALLVPADAQHADAKDCVDLFAK